MYTTYLVRHGLQQFDLKLVLENDSLKLRGLETITYKGSKPMGGRRPIARRPPSVAGESQRLLPESKGSIPQDLELRLPREFFQGHSANRHLRIVAGDFPSGRMNGFLGLMKDLLKHNLEWLCDVLQVKEIQPRLKRDINMGSCLLMLWRVYEDKNPWLLLRQMDKELGQSSWWYGQGKTSSLKIRYRAIRPQLSLIQIPSQEYEESGA